MENKQLDEVKSGWTKTLLVSTAVLGSMVLFTLPQQAKAATSSVETTTVQGGVTSGTDNNDTSEETNGGSQTDGSGDANDESGDTETPTTSTPTTEEETETTPSETAPVSASTTNTDSLKASSSDLQNAVDTAKDTGVAVTEIDPKVVTTTPDDLAETVSKVKDDNAQQISTLEETTAKQETDNANYDAAEESFVNIPIIITSTDTSEWSTQQIKDFLAGTSNATDQEAAAEAKNVVNVTFNKDTALNLPDNNSLNDGNLPTWSYTNALTDPSTGRSVDIIESITSYTPAKGTTNSWVDPNSSDAKKQIGFTPHNVQDVTVKVQYVDSITKEPVVLDVVTGYADLDGNQGVSVNNSYESVIYGSKVVPQADGSFRNTTNATLGSSDKAGQAWFLQKGVSETDYTFYVGLNSNGTVNNTQPIQFIGGTAFATDLPDKPTKNTESASYTPTNIEVTTTYDVSYTGNADDLPANSQQTVTWTGTYDATSQNYIWTPDKTNLAVETPEISGYSENISTAFAQELTATTTDPVNQQVQVTYTQTPSQLTVHYEDEDGNEIAPAMITDGYINDLYSAKPIDLTGSYYSYEKQADTSAPASGTLQASNVDVIFVYQKMVSQVTTPQDSGTLKINYVDENGNRLAPSVTKVGNAGSGYSVTPLNLTHSNYTYVGLADSSAPATGTMVADDPNNSADDVTITFVYNSVGQVTTPQDSELTVTYVDENGNTIAPDITKDSNIGNGYSVTPSDIPGYTYVGTTEKSSLPNGSLTESKQTITFVYQKDVISSPDNGQGTTDTPTTGTSTDDQTPATPVDTPVTTTDEPATTQPADSDIMDGTDEPAHVGQLQQTGAKTTVQSSQKADLSLTTAPASSTQTTTWSMGQPSRTTGQYGSQPQNAETQTTLPQTNDTRESGTLGLLGILVGLFGLAVTRKRKQQ